MRASTDDGLGAARPARPYVECKAKYHGGPRVLFTRLRVSGRGQQTLGQWPLFDGIASPETLALLLEHLAEEAPTDEEASNLRRAARYARSLSAATLRATLVSVLSEYAKMHFGPK